MKRLLCVLAVLLSTHYLLGQTLSQFDEDIQNHKREDCSNIGTEDGSYTLGEATDQIVCRNEGSTYFLPSQKEQESKESLSPKPFLKSSSGFCVATFVAPQLKMDPSAVEDGVKKLEKIFGITEEKTTLTEGVTDEIALTEKDSEKENGFWEKDLKEAAILPIVIAGEVDESEHVSASQERMKPTVVSVNKNNKTLLTIENFKNAAVTYPRAIRFIIKKGEEGNLSIEPEEGSEDSPQERINGENKKIAEELKKVLNKRHPDKAMVEDWFSSRGLLKAKKHPSLSAETISHLLEYSDQVSPSEVPKAASKMDTHLILAFQEKVKAAQLTSEAIQQSKSNIDPDFEEWLNNTIERFSFKVGKIRGMKADIDNEVIKVAEINIKRCLHYEKKKERIILDPECVDQLGLFEDEFSIKKSIEAAQEADDLLTHAIANNVKNLVEIAQTAQAAWVKVSEHANKSCEILKQTQDKVQGGLDHLEATDRYYQQHKTRWAAQLLKDHEADEVAWNAVFEAAAIIHHHILKNENTVLIAASKASLEAIIKAQQEKESFQRADEIARNCLQDPSVHFFQEEHVKPQFLKDMGDVWKRNDEIADFAQRATTVRKLIFDETKMIEASLQEDSFWNIETIDSLWKIENARLTANAIASSADAEVARTFSSTDEMDACKKALKAIQTIQAAEEVLTEQTKMKWMKEDEIAKNAWANNALLNAFFDQKGEMDKAVTLAKTAEENFTSKLNKVKESYLALIAVAESFNEGSDALGLENKIEALRQWGGSIKSSWKEAKKAAAATQQAWDQAHHATQAAMDSKITWARNIFRLAGRCTGDFSLGQATKRDGEFLGNLWIGSDDHSHQDEEGFDMSSDQLKRFRPLAYKSNLKKYQMNFERRPALNEIWTQKGQLTKKGHANGHLTIINPHDEDVKEGSLSRKFVALTTPSQFQEAYLEKRTEMQMEADGFFQEGQTTQKKLSTIKIQAKAARLDGRMLEAVGLDHQASIIEKDLEEIWVLAQQAYQKGLHAAPDSDQDWWRGHLDMLNIQSRMSNVDGNEALWNEAIEAMEEAGCSILENDRNNNQKAYDFVFADDEELRSFWMEHIKEFNISASQNDAFIFYCKANEEISSVKDSFKKAVTDRATHTEHEQGQAWDEIIQRINTTFPLLDKAIEKLNQYLVQAPEWDQLVVRQMIENAQDMKNQCIPSKLYAYTLKVNYLAEMASARAIHAQQEQLWDDAIQQHEKVKNLLNRTSVEFEKGLAIVPKSRMDLTGWWKQSLLSLQDDSLRWHMKELTNIANKATFIADIASTKTVADVAVNQEELWNDAIQKNEEARAAWEGVIEKFETFPNQISTLKKKCATGRTDPLKAAQDARDTRFFIIEQLKATRKERLSQKNQRVVKKK